MMKLRAVADFFAHQETNNDRTEQNCDKKAGQDGCYRTKHYVLIGIKTQPVSKDVTEMP